MPNDFTEQAVLVLKILPLLSNLPQFALKGGTAINYFFRPFPRMSVDIDLTFLPIQEREASLDAISAGLQQLVAEIAGRYPSFTAVPKKIQGRIVALRLGDAGAVIKIEPNLVIRGTVFPPQENKIAPEIEAEFGHYASCLCLSFADLYGGKICAALDRQHPRDLFDIKLLLENEGLTDQVRQAFIAYLISHPRPMAELLQPNMHDIKSVFESEFLGMTRIKVTVDELVSARRQLHALIHQQLTLEERKFILSVKKGEPEWRLFPIPAVENLPAVQWKLHNIKLMNPRKHIAAFEELQRALEL